MISKFMTALTLILWGIGLMYTLFYVGWLFHESYGDPYHDSQKFKPHYMYTVVNSKDEIICRATDWKELEECYNR